jgi:glycosyltransferase involved in cell wall biosynthesis
MRIAFADFLNIDFHAQTPDSRPLGGSQSAACYLARVLARRGHEVFIIGKVSAPGVYAGVTCLARAGMTRERLASLQLDVMVCLMDAGCGARLRDPVGTGTRLVLWNHHAANQPAVKGLAEPSIRAAYDGLVMVSEWQCQTFLGAFKIDPLAVRVLRNAVAPAFIDRFESATRILPQKPWPPILAYTSTPYRGLDLLLEAIPHIRQRVPGTRVRVFSSLDVYQVPKAEDEANYGNLYRRCREMEGVEYIGSKSQPELAQALREAMMLAYPNTFPETSCIAAMEAMASGCRVVSSNLAALPETTAGFARLIPIFPRREEYLRAFIDGVVEVLRECRDHPDDCEQLLQRQVRHINSTARWEARAVEWLDWLEQLSPRARP